MSVASIGPALKPSQRAAAAEAQVEVSEEEFYPPGMPDSQGLRRCGQWLLKLQQAFGPDVVHLWGPLHADLPWERPVLAAVHDCPPQWWRALAGSGGPEQWWQVFGRQFQRGIESADLVTVPTKSLLGRLRQQYAGMGQAEVVACGRDPGCASPGCKEPMLLTVSHPEDGSPHMSVMQRVSWKLRWPVFAAGWHGEVGVRGLGELSAGEWRGWLGRASIFALPLREEPLGLWAVEAAMAGCVLVLGDSPSMREQWEGAAEFVDVGDASGVAAMITMLINRPGQREQLAAAARRRAWSFNRRRMVSAYLHAYTQRIQKHATREQSPATR